MARDPVPTRGDVAHLPLPPGRFGLPLLGETIEFVRSPAAFLAERQRRYGNVFRTHILGARTIFLIGAEANQWIFAGEDRYLQNRWSYGIRRLLGAHSVSMLNGESHRERRRLLAPHFSPAAARERASLIYELGERHLGAWAERGGVTVALPVLRGLVFEIAVRILFSDTAVDLGYLSSRFETWVNGFFSLLPVGLAVLPLTPFGRALRAREELFAYLDALVEMRSRLREQPNDVLGSLLTCQDDAGRPLTREAIVHEIQLQLFAGHDTTLTALVNLMMLLALHPDVLHRARDEQRQPELLGERSFAALKKMPYTHQVLSEGLRLIPPVGGSFRVVTEDVSFQGYRLPRGWVVAISPRATHAGPPWSRSERFDPGRWTPGQEEHKLQPGSFIPFGGGPRVCLGQHFAMVEMAIVMALLLRHYDWTLVPGQDLEITPLPFPRPRSGLRVQFRRAGD